MDKNIFRKRVSNLVNHHKQKKAFHAIYDFTDLVTNGYDLNTMDDETILKSLEMECIADLKQMSVHTVFSKQAWQDRINRHLQTAGMLDLSRIKSLSEKAAQNILAYLESKGWGDTSHEYKRTQAEEMALLKEYNAAVDKLAGYYKKCMIDLRKNKVGSNPGNSAISEYGILKKKNSLLVNAKNIIKSLVNLR